MIKNNSKGITLVSLIASIIIMIIIAGVAITSIVGDNNTVDKAQNAVQKEERISEKTEVETAINKYNTKNFVKSYEKDGFEGFIEHELGIKDEECESINSTGSDKKYYYLTYGKNDTSDKYANKYWIIEEDEICRISDIPADIEAVLARGNYNDKIEKTWNGGVATNYSKGSGSQKNPYIIENAEELALLAKQVNEGEHFKGKYFRIVNDIDLNNIEFPCIGYGTTGNRSETTWSMNSRYFEGTLDGCNHKISNMKITLPQVHGIGLVGVLEKDGVVKNIEISSGELIGRTCIGGLVGASRGTIENCVNRANCTAQDILTNGSNSGQSAGGITGWATGGKIEKCINYGNILTKDDSKNICRGKCAGGIVGNVYIADPNNLVVIKKCKNYGNVISKYQLAGGIVGSNEFSEYTLNITDCENYGKIEIPKEWDMEGKAIGGFVGGIIGWINGPAEVKKCNNSGEIIGELGYCGGIVGDMTTGVISECKNSGKIDNEIYESKCNGGIIGYQENGKIENCVNTGNVFGNQKLGGIAGILADGKIVNSKNSGEISNLNNPTSSTLYKLVVGGIVGYQKSGEIELCENTGKISSTIQDAGGIVGRCSAGTIKKCSNFASILSKSDGGTGATGGIVGRIELNGVLENLYNSGSVESFTYINAGEAIDKAGGIAGVQTNGTIKNAYNKGMIKSSNCGGIVGEKSNGASLHNTYYYSINAILGVGRVVDASGNLLPNQDNLIKDSVNSIEKVTQNISSYSAFEKWIKNK